MENKIKEMEKEIMDLKREISYLKYMLNFEREENELANKLINDYRRIIFELKEGK